MVGGLGTGLLAGGPQHNTWHLGLLPLPAHALLASCLPQHRGQQLARQPASSACSVRPSPARLCGCRARVRSAPLQEVNAEEENEMTTEEKAAMDAEAHEVAAEASDGRGLPASVPQMARGSRLQSSAKKEIPLKDLPKVAIVGRPNVGKSALFNRITGGQRAIVFDFPGVTRDRLYTRAAWAGAEFVVVDTGGLMSDAAALPGGQRAAAEHAISAAGLPAAIERQAAAGVMEADAVVLVVDGQTGLSSADQEILAWLRRMHACLPVVLAVNKCESAAKADIQAAEFWGLGLQPFPVSAISGTGTGEMLDALVSALPPPHSTEEIEIDQEPLAIAIVGRPNVGKSSLLNALVGEERMLVSAVAGTTRDAIDTEVVLPDGRTFTLIDTAGIRRRTAVQGSRDGAEPLSVGRALAAMRRCEVVGLVLDASACVADGRFTVPQQDFRLAELVAGEGRACVVIINKWDAVPGKETNTLAEYEKDIRVQLRPLSWASLVFTSAVTGQRVARILEAAWAAGQVHRKRVSTATLNMVVREALNWRAPPAARGSAKKGRVYYATQAATRPPTFVFFVNDAKLFTDDYKRYMERQLRDNIGFPGTPLRIFWRGKEPSGGKPKPESAPSRGPER